MWLRLVSSMLCLAALGLMSGCASTTSQLRKQHARSFRCPASDVVFGQVEGDHFFSHGCGQTLHYQCTEHSNGRLASRAKCRDWPDPDAQPTSQTFRMSALLSVMSGAEGNATGAVPLNVIVYAEPVAHPYSLFFDVTLPRTHTVQRTAALRQDGLVVRHESHSLVPSPPALASCQHQVMVDGTVANEGTSTHSANDLREHLSTEVKLEHAPAILRSIRTTGAVCNLRWTLSDKGKSQLADFIVRVREETAIRNPNAVQPTQPTEGQPTTTL